MAITIAPPQADLLVPGGGETNGRDDFDGLAAERAAVRAAEWCRALPVLHSSRLTLREMRVSDARVLRAEVAVDPVSRFLAAPPENEEGFERFIRWAQQKRAEGSFACFAIVPKGQDQVAGFFQLRALTPGFHTAEWGFALGRRYWGQGLFAEGAAEMLAFAFDQLGVKRLEARAMAANDRGNAALRRLGATHEGRLRDAFEKHGRRYDANLWTILDTEWQAIRAGHLHALVVPERFH